MIGQLIASRLEQRALSGMLLPATPGVGLLTNYPHAGALVVFLRQDVGSRRQSQRRGAKVVARGSKALSGGVAVFAAGGIAGTLVAVAAKLIWDGLVDRLAGWDLVVLVLLTLAVVVLTIVVVSTSGKVDHLIEKANFSVKYYPAEEADELYRRSRDVISRSEPDVEIYAVNSYVEVFKESNSESDADSQRRYLAEFEKKFKTVKYHRLIQVKNGQRADDGTALADLLAPAYLEHYRKMAQFASKNPGKRIKLEEVPAKLPTSFVVVKDKNASGGKIIWQVNKHDPSADSPDIERIMGVLLITDPDDLLVTRFLQWFDELDRNSRELTLDLLQPKAQ
ncbi:MAG TPA: hypothetical protein VFV67_13445 [Actinophytocola sp.]|uniref:hypothetical protein n=1 Tax=Actinophytocola sp. TaxID=1872138 RepID=UPI002DB840FB|nr:hypothetical protein [Actinophytocola sp.]HEU5471653.1 hypothetical protein [Actinophytocola sp.]